MDYLKKHWEKFAVLVVLVLLVVGAACLHYRTKKLQTVGYQAVFLSNGQVYFGKLSRYYHQYQLTDIYYLQVTQNLQQASSDATKTPTSTGTAQNQNSIQLVKLGSELHGPTDAMYIERDKILFWENMKDDSKVVQAIHQYQNKQQ